MTTENKIVAILWKGFRSKHMQYELLTRGKPSQSIKLTTEQGLGISPGLCFTDSSTSLNHGVKLAIQ